MTPQWKLAVAVLLLVPTPVAGDWLQYGGDAARTSVADADGPLWNDVAFMLDAQGYGAGGLGWPIVVDDQAYFFINGSQRYADHFQVGPERPSTLYRVDLASARTAKVADVYPPLYELASDGEMLYGAGRNVLTALALDGVVVWSRPVYAAAEMQGPAVPASIGRLGPAQTCHAPALRDLAIYVACRDDTAGYGLIVAQAFDLQGNPLWEAPFVADAVAPPNCPQDATTVDQRCPFWMAGHPRQPTGFDGAPLVSLVGDHLFVVASKPGRTSLHESEVYNGGWVTYAVNVTTGDGHVLAQQLAGGSPGAPYAGVADGFAAAPVGNAGGLFLAAGRLWRYDAGDPRFLNHTHERSMFSAERPLWSVGPALRDEDLYVASANGLHLLGHDLEDQDGWTPFELPLGEEWAPGPLVLLNNILLARTHVPLKGSERAHIAEGRSILYAFHPHTGEPLWRHAFDESTRFAVGDRAILAVDRLGTVTVLGSSDAAIAPVAKVSSRYPASGDTVRVDLAASRPGQDGPATEFRVDWGDGATDSWQDQPLFEHRYDRTGDMTARFFLRNDAGQTASIVVPFFVGTPDPAVNIFNSPFADQYQETTFFLLGLLLTGLLALFGVYRAGRKRRFFEKELRALEADHQALAGDPARCDLMLFERKTRARELFLRKRLEDAQAAFLERRADEMRQGLRMGQVEERLKFLPHGVVQQLRRLLADGRVDAWERSHFIEALEREASLSRSQRQEARRLIDGWFNKDMEGAR